MKGEVSEQTPALLTSKTDTEESIICSSQLLPLTNLLAVSSTCEIVKAVDIRDFLRSLTVFNT